MLCRHCEGCVGELGGVGRELDWGGRSWGVVVIYEPVTSRHLRHQTNKVVHARG